MVEGMAFGSWVIPLRDAEVKFDNGPDDDPSLADHISVTITLVDGTRWWGHFCSTGRIATELSAWDQVGPPYFCQMGLVVTPGPGRQLIIGIIESIVADGRVQAVFHPAT